MTNIRKHCLACNKEFYVWPNPQNANRKYCSRECYIKASKGRKNSPESIERMRQAKLGHGWPEGYAERQSKAQKKRFEIDNVWNKGISYGRAKWFWKDRPNEYRNLHKRIQRKYGTPKLCEHCGRTDLQRYQWANKTGKYLEIREDWLRLCQSCHMKYDKVNKV